MRSRVVRVIWVLLTNGAFLFLAFWGGSREAQLQQLLHPTQRVPVVHLLIAHPWDILVIVVLLVGIVLEVIKVRAAAFVNCGYYLTALLVGIWGILADKNIMPSEHIIAGLWFYVVPVLAIAAVDCWLYRNDLRIRKIA